jgi:hypothetical protein
MDSEALVDNSREAPVDYSLNSGIALAAAFFRSGDLTRKRKIAFIKQKNEAYIAELHVHSKKARTGKM